MTKIKKKSLNSRKWTTVRDYVRTRDEHTCQICGYKTLFVIQVHHIHKRNINSNLTYDEKNLICVCSKCHNMLDKTKIFYNAEGLPITSPKFVEEKLKLTLNKRKQQERGKLW